MNIYDDPQTVLMAKLLETSSRDFLSVLGHYYRGPDGFVYRVIGYRENDGPWIEEVLGRTATRTISLRAIGRTFHHYRKCAAENCDAHFDCDSALRNGFMNRTLEWSGTQQVTDGKTIWINANDGMCIGRLSAKGLDVHASLLGQASGDHCLYCEPGPEPFAEGVTIVQYMRFIEKMKEHHDVEVSHGLHIRILPAPALG